MRISTWLLTILAMAVAVFLAAFISCGGSGGDDDDSADDTTGDDTAGDDTAADDDTTAADDDAGGICDYLCVIDNFTIYETCDLVSGKTAAQLVVECNEKCEANATWQSKYDCIAGFAVNANCDYGANCLPLW